MDYNELFRLIASFVVCTIFMYALSQKREAPPPRVRKDYKSRLNRRVSSRVRTQPYVNVINRVDITLQTKSDPDVLILMEDDISVRMFQFLIGKKLEIPCFATQDSSEAKAMIKQHTPRLIILDHHNQEPSSLELLKIIRTDQRLEACKVLICANFGNHYLEWADDVWGAPISSEMIEKYVARVFA